jgi:hypothetical protein
MKSSKRLGIWMDHSSAHLMEFTDNSSEVKTIESKTGSLTKKQVANYPESLTHDKQWHCQIEYYQKLSEVIQHYEEVVLFGPTEEKVELFDVMSEDKRCLKLKVEIKETSEMSEDQQHDFVKDYFSV